MKMDAGIAFCALIMVAFALLNYVCAFVTVGTSVATVAQAIGQTMGGDLMLFIAGVCWQSARNEYRAR